MEPEEKKKDLTLSAVAHLVGVPELIETVIRNAGLRVMHGMQCYNVLHQGGILNTPYKSAYASVIKRIYLTEGLKGFYRGLLWSAALGIAHDVTTSATRAMWVLALPGIDTTFISPFALASYPASFAYKLGVFGASIFTLSLIHPIFMGTMLAHTDFKRVNGQGKGYFMFNRFGNTHYYLKSQGAYGRGFWLTMLFSGAFMMGHGVLHKLYDASSSIVERRKKDIDSDYTTQEKMDLGTSAALFLTVCTAGYTLSAFQNQWTALLGIEGYKKITMKEVWRTGPRFRGAGLAAMLLIFSLGAGMDTEE